MADNFENKRCNLLKRRTSRQLRIIKKKKIKSRAKRKSDKYFERKQLINSICRKKCLKMNLNRTAEITSPSDRCPQYDDMDEATYWKARAISLEFENKMLHSHIKQMYISMISQNQQLAQDEEYFANDDYSTQDMDTAESETETECKIEIKKEKEEKAVDFDEENSQPPDEYNTKKNKEEEMRTLYGSSWRVVRGMETAVQLNFNIIIGKKKPAYWPVVPIKP